MKYVLFVGMLLAVTGVLAHTLIINGIPCEIRGLHIGPDGQRVVWVKGCNVVPTPQKVGVKK